MRCPICNGSGSAPEDALGYARHVRACGTDASGTDDSGGRICRLCHGSGRLAAAIDGGPGGRPHGADDTSADKRLEAEREMLTLLLDYCFAFSDTVTARWRHALQLLDLESPVFSAALLSDIRASFESEKTMLRARYDWMSAHESRPFERECREIERGLAVLYAIVEEAALRLRNHPEQQGDGDPAQ